MYVYCLYDDTVKLANVTTHIQRPPVQSGHHHPAPTLLFVSMVTCIGRRPHFLAAEGGHI